MKELLIYIIVCYGITNIMVYSHMFKGWRTFWERVSLNFFGKLFSCMMCLSFWVGIVFSTTLFLCDKSNLSPFLFYGINPFVGVFLDGCFSSGMVWILHTAQELLERVGKKD